VAAGEGVPADPVRGRVDRARVGGVEGHVDAAGVVVEAEDVLPGPAAVARLEQAALPVGRPQVPQRGDVGRLGVGGGGGDAVDVVGVGEAGVGPGRAGVAGDEDAVAPGDAVAGVGLAGADPDDLGARRADGDGADGGVRPAGEDAGPAVAVVRGLPQAA